MKILIVNKFLYPNGGSETYIFKVGGQLQKMGHEVEYFGMEHEGRIVGNHAECYTADMDFHGGGLSKLLYPFKIIYSRETYQKITTVLEDFKPDVVHLNNFHFQLTPSIIYAIRKFGRKQGRKIPIVMTAHDSQLVCPNHLMTVPSDGRICFDCEKGHFGCCTKNRCIHDSKVKSLLASAEAYLYRFLKTYRYLDLLICPSEFLKSKMATNPLLAERATVMHNFVGVPEDNSWKTISTNGERAVDEGAASNEEAVVHKKQDYVLYFGRYSSEKGIASLVKICEQLPDIPFVFVGDGPLKEQVENLSNVENRGFLSGDVLYQTIAEAKLVLFPSECNENCPFSVMEAQMLGTPVLGSNLGGIPELIEEGKTGYILEAGNIAQWTGKIQELWNNPAALEELTSACAGVKFYTVEEYCDILLNKMQELCKGDGK